MTVLIHHGIRGQKWGKRNGPPYPLNAEDHSVSEKKAGWRKSLDKGETDDFGISVTQAVNGEFGTGYLKTHNREQIAKINALDTDEATKRKLLKDEDRAYKKALRKQAWNDRGKQQAKEILIAAGAVTIVAATIYVANNPDVFNGLIGNAVSQDLGVMDQIVPKKMDLPELAPDAMDAWNTVIDGTPSYHYDHNFVDNIKLLDRSEQEAIRDYTGGIYQYVNDKLWNGTESLDWYKDETAKVIERATSGLEKCRISEDTIIHRGTKPEFAASMLGLSNAKDLGKLIKDNPKALNGVIVNNKGFASAGIDQAHSWGMGFNMHILCPAGTKGMYVNPISQHPLEQELLLQRGTRLKVVGAKTGGSKGIDMFFEVVDQVLDEI